MQNFMSNTILLQTYQSLPKELKQEISDFVEFVKQKYTKTAINQTLIAKPKRKLGKFPKGSFVMSNDFNEPLDHFNDYM